MAKTLNQKILDILKKSNKELSVSEIVERLQEDRVEVAQILYSLNLNDKIDLTPNLKFKIKNKKVKMISRSKLKHGNIQVWECGLDGFWDYSLFIKSSSIYKTDYKYNNDSFKTRQSAIYSALNHIKRKFKGEHLEIDVHFKEYIGKDYE